MAKNEVADTAKNEVAQGDVWQSIANDLHAIRLLLEQDMSFRGVTMASATPPQPEAVRTPRREGVVETPLNYDPKEQADAERRARIAHKVPPAVPDQIQAQEEEALRLEDEEALRSEAVELREPESREVTPPKPAHRDAKQAAAKVADEAVGPVTVETKRPGERTQVDIVEPKKAD